MDPSSRAPLGALLLALLLRALPAPACSRLPPGHVHLFAEGAAQGANAEIGKCNGTGAAPPPPAEEPPASLAELRRAGFGEEWMKALRGLEYRADDAADRLLDGKGKPLSQERVNWLFSPVDASHTRISFLAWQTLQVGGYRIDEGNCQMTHPERPPVMHIDILMLEDQVRRGTEHSALETLKAGLRGLPPGSAVPPELVARLRAMEQAQVRLPESVRRLLFAETPPKIGDLAATLGGSYAASTAFFDGQRALDSFVTAARPLGTPGASPPRAPAHMRSAEQRLGELLSRDLQAVFERTEPGRDVLAQFRRPDGSTPLPPMLVVKLSQRPEDSMAGAIYNDEARQVVFNHWELARLTLAQVPEAERTARAREFADTDALRRYLEANPAVRARVVDNMDHLVLHEFVHYRQGDVAKVMAEGRRGNVPGGNPLSIEHEAYRQECRYYLARVAQDPTLLTRGYGGNRNEMCPQVLRDPEQLDNTVTDLYTRAFAGQLRLPELSRMQEVRRDAAWETLTGAATPLEDRARAALKLLGYRHGDDAIKDEERRVEAFRAAYAAQLAPLRPGLAAAPGALLRAGKPYQALSLLNAMGWEGHEEQARADVLEARRLLVAGERRSALEERLHAWNLVVTLGPRVGAGPTDAAFGRAYAADIEVYAAELRRRAGSLPAEQAAELARQAAGFEQSARSWRGIKPQQVPRRPATR